MPRIIRRALFEKLTALSEWQSLCDHFSALSGLKLELLDELGRGAGDRKVTSHCLQILPCCIAGQHCGQFRQKLIGGGGGGEGAVVATCDAQLKEAAVPIRVGEVDVGHIVFSGFRTAPAEECDIGRARHLLERAKVPFEATALRASLDACPVIEPPVLKAYIHFVELAAERLASHLSTHLSSPGDELPAPVSRACEFIRREALTRDIRLQEVAKRSGVSSGHLSRLFHQSTGLTYSEYVSRMRAEHARDLLLNTDRNITEAAYDSGFQSLSQFHRVFRRVFGLSPRELRRRNPLLQSPQM